METFRAVDFGGFVVTFVLFNMFFNWLNSGD
jgi:hypothetical protein